MLMPQMPQFTEKLIDGFEHLLIEWLACNPNICQQSNFRVLYQNLGTSLTLALFKLQTQNYQTDFLVKMPLIDVTSIKQFNYKIVHLHYRTQFWAEV